VNVFANLGFSEFFYVRKDGFIGIVFELGKRETFFDTVLVGD